MTEEVTPPVVEPEVAPVDLDANPPDGTVGKSHEGFQAKADEPAAVVEPVVEPAAEVAPPPAEPKEDGHDKAVWGDTGTESGNSVLGMLQESGISPADAKAILFDGINSGDPSQIDMEALTAKVGKNAANIIMTGAKNFIAEKTAHNATAITAVHEAAGSKENWDTAVTWARANIPEADLAEYRPMLDKGGAASRFAVAEIMAKYNADESNSTLAPSTPRAEGTSTSAPASTATTRAEYVKQLELAHKRRASPKELAVIQANRNAGRKQGI